MKHTPGPWRANINKEGTSNHFIVNESGQSCIAAVHLDVPQIETEANAKLISAAPELLAALKYYFDVLNEVRGQDWYKNPDHVLSKMLSATEKAGLMQAQ